MTDEQFNLIEDSIAHYTDRAEFDALTAEIRRLRSIAEPLERLLAGNGVAGVTIDLWKRERGEGYAVEVMWMDDEPSNFSGATISAALAAAVEGCK